MIPANLVDLLQKELRDARAPLSARTLARRVKMRTRIVAASLRAGAGTPVEYQSAGSGKSRGCLWTSTSA